MPGRINEQTQPDDDDEDEGSPLVLLMAGDGVSASHVLPEEGDLEIGRTGDVAIVVPSDSVSRRHAILRARE